MVGWWFVGDIHHDDQMNVNGVVPLFRLIWPLLHFRKIDLEEEKFTTCTCSIVDVIIIVFENPTLLLEMNLSAIQLNDFVKNVAFLTNCKKPLQTKTCHSVEVINDRQNGTQLEGNFGLDIKFNILSVCVNKGCHKYLFKRECEQNE